MKYSIFQQTLSENYRKLFVEGYHHVTVDEKKWSLPLRDRALIGSFARMMSAPRYLNRVALKTKVARRHAPLAAMQDGYAICSGREVPGMMQAIAVAEAKLQTYLKVKAGAKEVGESFDPARYQQELAKADKDPLKHVPYGHDREAAIALLKPFLQPEMYLTAANHLGVLPVLTSIRIAFSPNDEPLPLRSSQMFHVDPEGARQVKVFVAAREVGPDNSPFTFVPERQTCRMLESGGEAFLGRRVKDEKLAKYAPRSEWVSHMGPPGELVFIDTSRCFHYGSRPAPKARLLLYAQYLDPFCSVFAASAKLRRKLGGNHGFYETDDPIEQHVLGRR